MTVGELITALAKFSSDTEVYVEDPERGPFPVTALTVWPAIAQLQQAQRSRWPSWPIPPIDSFAPAVVIR